MKLIVTTALAVLMAFPAFAHSDSTMNEENALFQTCKDAGGVEVCSIKREVMECEPASDYENSWKVFVDRKGLPAPVNQGQTVDPNLGPIGFIAVRMSEHYGHTYIYIVLEDLVCLGAIAHFPEGEPA